VRVFEQRKRRSTTIKDIYSKREVLRAGIADDLVFQNPCSGRNERQRAPHDIYVHRGIDIARRC
jgi:uncharacterized circularly permuted ATP-grasp superfamily protein